MLRKNVKHADGAPPIELRIGDDIVVKILRIGDKTASLAIDAPKNMLIQFMNAKPTEVIDR